MNQYQPAEIHYLDPSTILKPYLVIYFAKPYHRIPDVVWYFKTKDEAEAYIEDPSVPHAGHKYREFVL